MHKVMVFIDYQNFFISWKWKNRGRKPPFVDYQKLGRLINRQIPLDSEVIKTYLFAYKPCDELMLLEPYQRYYWMTIFCIGLVMHHMAEKREAERGILPGFHRKKSEFEFKLLYYNQKRRALSSSFFQSPGPDNTFFHQVVRCHDDHILKRFDRIGSSRFPVI